MQSYEWSMIERNFDKRYIYDKGYKVGENKVFLKAFNCTIDILIKKDMIIRMHDNDLSIEMISSGIKLDKEIVQKIIDSKEDFNFKTITNIIKEHNLIEL